MKAETEYCKTERHYHEVVLGEKQASGAFVPLTTLTPTKPVELEVEQEEEEPVLGD
jgi:hypothetical protein